ncbi:MAG: single-stranded DNA-binding protein [Candidatus Kapabacteria bacterium]|nr:single-stranded DNA-binding protein [Candidatus Kapabacteria bacterium]
MSRTLNKVMLIGNVGKDPDVNFTPSGVKVAQLRLATSESWKDKDGAVQEHTDWHTIIAWRGLADVVERLVHRGSRIYIEGKIQSRSFEDRDGNKRYVTEIVADNLLLLDAKKVDHLSGSGEPEHHEVAPATDSEDIPF